VYAVIRSGGKQYKVSEGDVIDVEKVGEGSSTIKLTPVLVVDDKGKATSGKDLKSASVTAKIVGENKGPKVDIFKYRSKTRYRRNLGHRQKYTTVEISKISLSGGTAKKTTAKTPAKKTTAKKTTAKAKQED
jgi:large subunit ribosomal protein L21